MQWALMSKELSMSQGSPLRMKMTHGQRHIFKGVKMGTNY